MALDKAFGITLILSGTCYMFIWVTAFLQTVKWSTEAINKQHFSFSYVNQITRDWQQKPYQSLIVTSESSCPESHPELVFSRPWYGNDIGCDCIGIFSDQYLDLEDNANRIERGIPCSHNKTLAGCQQANPHPAVQMGQFNGKRVCGKMTDFDFLTMVRVGSDGLCPEEFTACNPESVLDNRICVRTNKDSSEPVISQCPINAFAILKKTDLPSWK